MILKALCTIMALSLVISSSAFVATPAIGTLGSSLSAVRQDQAAALTDFMAKAHEEKIRAIERVEAKYKDKIAELEAKIADLEGPNTASSDQTSANSFAFPATNKLLTQKIKAYQSFLSRYIVNASLEKQKAVKDAESKTAAKYEAMHGSLKD